MLQNRKLAGYVTGLGKTMLTAKALPHDQEWPVEDGFFVLDLPSAAALAIAELFGQNAVVTIEQDGAADLAFTSVFVR